MAKKKTKLIYKVYRLRDPRTGKVRYIGMTQQSLVKRVHQHMSQKDNCSLDKYNWLRELIWTGYNPLIETIAEFENRELALQAETAWIYLGLSQGWDLFNKERKQFTKDQAA